MPLEGIQGIDLLHNCNEDFEALAIAVYRYQYQNNELYRAFNKHLGVKAHKVDDITKIPFLPISFFKSHKVYTPTSGVKNKEIKIFESSGTTGTIPSRHFVRDTHLYDTVALKGFEAAYGAIQDWVILALLPSYLERNNSSLVHMAQMLMRESGHPDNGFYLQDFKQLASKIQVLTQQSESKVLLLGVTFALLDFAEQHPMEMGQVVVMETGGMKGRKQEWTRSEVHEYLCEKWQLNRVHSEYGMTELLSQAYAPEQGFFEPISTMQALVRDINDPLDCQFEGLGGLNIIDLANVHSCSFIATEDIGRVFADGRFEVLGRLDFSALRGCSLMVL